MAKAESLKEIERAEKALEAAKRKHREDFRKAVFAVYEAYGLRIVDPDETARLVIISLANETLDQAVPK
jgi:hypothetical protein